MDWIPQIFRRCKFYEDLSEEIRLHIEERTEQLMRDRMSAEEATRVARQAFGNRTLLEERSREVEGCEVSSRLCPTSSGR